MSPRRNRPPRRGWAVRRFRRDGGHTALDAVRVRRGVDTVARWRGERWWVRDLTGAGTEKTYRCPGCDHEVRPGVPHVVVWPAEGELSDRRHWHTGCWHARDRRAPSR